MATKKSPPTKPVEVPEPEAKASKEPPTQLDDLSIPAKKRRELERLCSDYIDAQELQSSWGKQMKELAPAIKALAAELKLPASVCNEDFKLTVTEGVSKTLVATKLLSLGVSNEIIEKATKVTPKVTMRLTRASEDATEEYGE